jgi:hypothetical protein
VKIENKPKPISQLQPKTKITPTQQQSHPPKKHLTHVGGQKPTASPLLPGGAPPPKNHPTVAPKPQANSSLQHPKAQPHVQNQGTFKTPAVTSKQTQQGGPPLPKIQTTGPPPSASVPRKPNPNAAVVPKTQPPHLTQQKSQTTHLVLKNQGAIAAHSSHGPPPPKKNIPTPAGGGGGPSAPHGPASPKKKIPPRIVPKSASIRSSIEDKMEIEESIMDVESQSPMKLEPGASRGGTRTSPRRTSPHPGPAIAANVGPVDKKPTRSQPLQPTTPSPNTNNPLKRSHSSSKMVPQSPGNGTPSKLKIILPNKYSQKNNNQILTSSNGPLLNQSSDSILKKYKPLKKKQKIEGTKIMTPPPGVTPEISSTTSLPERKPRKQTREKAQNNGKVKQALIKIDKLKPLPHHFGTFAPSFLLPSPPLKTDLTRLMLPIWSFSSSFLLALFFFHQYSSSEWKECPFLMFASAYLLSETPTFSSFLILSFPSFPFFDLGCTNQFSGLEALPERKRFRGSYAEDPPPQQQQFGDDYEEIGHVDWGIPQDQIPTDSVCLAPPTLSRTFILPSSSFSSHRSTPH